MVLQERHQTIGVAANNTSAATEILCRASRRLPTTETGQRLVQRCSVGRVHHLCRDNDEPAAGGYLQGKEIHPCIAIVMQTILRQARAAHSAERTQHNTRKRTAQKKNSWSRTQSAERTQRRAAHTMSSKAHTGSQSAHAINSAPPHESARQQQKKKLGSVGLARPARSTDARQ